MAVTVNGDYYRAILSELLFTKIEEEHMTTFSFNKAALPSTQPKLHLMFVKISLSADV